MKILEIEIDNENFRFLCACPNPSARADFMAGALTLQVRGKTKGRMTIKREEYTVAINGTGKYFSIEGYGGMRYDAEIIHGNKIRKTSLLLGNRINQNNN